MKGDPYHNECWMLKQFRKMYNNYRTSTEWKSRRNKFLKDKSRCEGCKEKFSSKLTPVVHHLSYEHLTMERDNELMALCRSCHRAVHKIQKEARLTILVATSEVTGINAKDLHLQTYGEEGVRIWNLFKKAKKKKGIAVPPNTKPKSLRRSVEESVKRWT